MKLFGGIEAGGTKFICIVSSGPDKIMAETRFPTTTPEKTLQQVVNFFQEQSVKQEEPISAIGIGCFGPVDLDPASPTFGFITLTPKPGWSNTDMVGTIRKAMDLPVVIDTDVNAAAVGEWTWGAGKDLNDFIYLTIGTGIGGGGVINGKTLHGLVHPEMGHMRIPHDWQVDPFIGTCPYHGDCFEGLAAGPTIKARWGQAGETLPVDHPAWNLEAKYIALAVQNLVCILSPKRVILGGGVMQQSNLLPLIRKNVSDYLNNYVQSPAILNDIDHYIVAPELGNQAGVMGAIALAQRLVGYY
ncbi:MAG TPA: ROK family protein [Anaerolineaceae bacterium]|nr:ROK family protein [Anaerolineaceae bacterium]